MLRRYQNYREPQEEEIMKSIQFTKTALFFSNPYPKGNTGDTWDAKHMNSFLNRSNYSNWRGNQPNISRMSEVSHKRSYSSTQGDHFFKTTKDNKNQSKIGFTPIFPLVSNAPISPAKELTVSSFFNSQELNKKEETVVSGRSLKLRCSQKDNFKFAGNAIKYKHSDPVTCQNQPQPFETLKNHQKQRMSRLISCRHPHGLTGIDHNQNPESKYYNIFEEKIKTREEPNSHRTFLIDKEWKQKKRSKAPVDEWKTRRSINIRSFRNQNTHGFNILTNRLVQ